MGLGKVRVIYLPTTVGGNPQGISKQLNRLGVKSETWTLSQNYFGYTVNNSADLIAESFRMR